jgi:dienelactone hydrolase
VTGPAGRTVLASGTPALVRSAGGPARRGVVVVPDVFGLSPVFEDIADRLAAEVGAAVGVLEPFPGNEAMTLPERLESGVRDLDESRVLGDARDLADHLDVEPVAILGVCIGGMLAMRGAASGRFDRVVSLYGMVHVPAQWQGGGKGDPLAAVTAASAKVPVLAFAGTDDEFVPEAHLDELASAGADVRRFAGASHGFVHDPRRPNHDARAAKEVWGAVGEFLAVPARSHERVRGISDEIG